MPFHTHRLAKFKNLTALSVEEMGTHIRLQGGSQTGTQRDSFQSSYRCAFHPAQDSTCTKLLQSNSHRCWALSNPCTDVRNSKALEITGISVCAEVEDRTCTNRTVSQNQFIKQAPSFTHTCPDHVFALREILWNG